jgi:hypothetical protein
MAEGSDAPAARAGDLRDQPVDVNAEEEAADLGTLLVRVIAEVAGELGGSSRFANPYTTCSPLMRATESW